MNKQDGGPAFPQIKWERDDDGNLYPDEKHGMTLRDYFAAKAMQPDYTDVCLRGREENMNFHPEWWTAIARNAYQMADAMLRAREE